MPDAVERWIRFYQQKRYAHEGFNAFTERVGKGSFEELVKDLALPVEFSLENIDHFIDWERSSPFAAIRGEGECAV